MSKHITAHKKKISELIILRHAHKESIIIIIIIFCLHLRIGNDTELGIRKILPELYIYASLRHFLFQQYPHLS